MFKKFGGFYKIDNNSINRKVFNHAPEETTAPAEPPLGSNSTDEDAPPPPPKNELLLRHRQLSLELDRRFSAKKH